MTRSKLFTGALMALVLPALMALSTEAEAKRSRKAKRAKRAKISGKVNLNTARIPQLTLLPRIGKSTAKRIVAYRAKQRFNAIRDIMRVKGVGKRTFLRAKAHLTVRGPNTLRKLKLKRKRSKRKGRRRSTKRRSKRCRC